MTKTIHIKLAPRDAITMTLRYAIDQPANYQERVLPLAAIESIIAAAETDYYTYLHADFAETGQRLYRWLDGPDRVLTSCIAACQGSDVVLVLAIDLAGRLSHLPWELLHDGVTFLVAKPDLPIVPIRWSQGTGDTGSPENRPLQLLFMATSPAEVEPVLDFEREEALILAATQRQPLVLTVEESGNLDELHNLLADYGPRYFDVFHLTGHGTRVDDEPRFVTENAVGAAVYANAAALKKALLHPPRLLFLSGCRTGEASHGGYIPSLAEALLGLGLKNVLGWGRPILDRDASVAAAALYQALAEGLTLPHALAQTYRALIETQVSDWHLLRLYTVGEAPQPLVTPLRTKGRKVAPRLALEEQFLDDEQRVRVANRQHFVGRRRTLQRCLQTLRNPTGKPGLLLWGMGGLGKSTLAARLADRLPTHQAIVWVGTLDEESLIHKLADKVRAESALAALNSSAPLHHRLRDFLTDVETPLLLIFDNFEDNFEQRNGVIALPDGQPLLTAPAAQLLHHLLFALRESQRDHRLLITSRYSLDPALPEMRWFAVEPLAALPEADVEKKVNRLTPRHEQSVDEKAHQARAVTLADGNPRLLEWLFEVLAQPGLDHATLLDKLAAKALEFRENILATELLQAQPPAVRQLLARLLVYELPVPQRAVDAVCPGLGDRAAYQQRAAALGLLEKTTALPDAELHWRVPRILAPLLDAEQPAEPVALAQSAAQTLYQLWWQGDSGCSEVQALEIHRLALAGGANAIATAVANALGTRWNNRSRFREAATLTEKTLATVGADYRLWLELARAQATLGLVEQAIQYYQQALQACPADDEERKAAILGNMGDIFAQQGRIDKTLQLYQEAKEIYERNGKIGGQATALHQMANLSAQRGEIEQALDLYQQSLDLSERIGDVKGKARTLNQMAILYGQQEEIEQALDLYQQALDLKERIGDVQGKATTLHAMADLFVQQGELEQALDLYQQALDLKERIGDVQGKATTLHAMANLFVQQGELEQALDLYRQALDLTERIGDVYSKAFTLAMLAQLLAATRQQYTTAVGYLQEALAIFTRLKAPERATVEAMLNNVVEATLVHQLQIQGVADPEAHLATLDEAAVQTLLVQAGVLVSPPGPLS